jgi:hypothetical protein
MHGAKLAVSERRGELARLKMPAEGVNFGGFIFTQKEPEALPS